MATETLERVTFTTVRDLSAEPEAMEQLRDGLANAWAMADDAESSALYDAMPSSLGEHPAMLAYESLVVDAAIADIAPTVARMLQDAMAKRLPWTWERER